MGTARDLCFMVIVYVAISQPKCFGFDNSYDGLLDYSCGKEKQAISSIFSIHNNGKEDRIFRISCRDVKEAKGTARCYFSDNWENSYDNLLDFECYSNGFITGMTSVHTSKKEDRRWKFRCCEYKDVILYECRKTDWTNDFDGLQNYRVPTGMVIKGVTSHHSNAKEDRQYKYNICKVTNSWKCGNY